MLRKY